MRSAEQKLLQKFAAQADNTVTIIQRCYQLDWGNPSFATYRVSQNYPNMYFSTIISTALKPLKMWIPKFYEMLIKRQS